MPFAAWAAVHFVGADRPNGLAIFACIVGFALAALVFLTQRLGRGSLVLGGLLAGLTVWLVGLLEDLAHANTLRPIHGEEDLFFLDLEPLAFLLTVPAFGLVAMFLAWSVRGAGKPPRSHEAGDLGAFYVALRSSLVLEPLASLFGQGTARDAIVVVALALGVFAFVAPLVRIGRRRLWLRRVRRGQIPDIRVRARAMGERLDGLVPLVGDGRELVIERVEDPGTQVYRATLVKTPLALL